MNRNLIIGGTLSLIAVMAALVSFVWTPFDHASMNIPEKLQTPNLVNWFGTDHFGRDMFSMIMVGARTSIAVAFVAVGIGMGLGIPLGLWAAARKGAWIDELIMRANDLIFRLSLAGDRDPDHGDLRGGGSECDHRHRHL